MLLNQMELEIAGAVVDRFLNLGEATPRRALLLKAQSRELLDKLARWSILTLYDNKEFLPRAFAFHCCGNIETSLLAKRSIEIVGRVLRNLFENDPNEDINHTVIDVEDHARKLYGTVATNEIRLGLYLGHEFGFFMGWSGNQTHTQVTHFLISEHIIEINPDNLWDDYIARQTQWIQGQLSEDSNPFPDTNGDAELASGEDSPTHELGQHGGWEIIKSLTKNTGQSEVFLVRSPHRVAALTQALKAIHRFRGGVSLDEAPAFATAILQSAREDSISELGALKVFKMRGEGAEAEQEVLARLRREIQVLKQNKPGLLRLLDANEDQRWIITEYQPNGTFADHPFRFKGNAASALRSFRPLVETVAALHNDKIVHRDIKPGNVFLGDGPNLVLGDFGIVYLPNEPERVTRTNERVGPHDYMPPWADLGERLEKIDPNFDVYMLGKLLWCMASGRLRLPRERFREPKFDLTQLFPDDPHMHMINSILEKCIVEEPKDCLATASELLPTVDTYLRVIERGGQLIGAKIPKICRICGMGHYQLKLMHPNTPHAGLRLWHGGGSSDSAVLRVQVFMCDNCKHIDFFAQA